MFVEYESCLLDRHNEHHCSQIPGIDDCQGILPRIENFDLLLRRWDSVRAAIWDVYDLDEFRIEGRRLLAQIEKYLSGICDTLLMDKGGSDRGDSVTLSEESHEQRLCLEHLQQSVDKFKQMWWFSEPVEQLGQIAS